VEIDIRESMISDFQRPSRRYPLVAQIVTHLVDGKLMQHEAWALLTMLFSNTNLTYEEDILPCLSALANRTQRQTSGTYLAGIWQEDIPACLAWHTYTYNTSRRPKRRKFLGHESNSGSPQDFVAPSFSWTSHVGRIVWCDVVNGSKCGVQLVDSKCTPRGTDPFGEVVDGFILIKGRLIVVQAKYSGFQGIFRRCEKSSSGSWVTTDQRFSPETEIWDTPEDKPNSLGLSRPLHWSIRTPPVEPVFFLWLCTTPPTQIDPFYSMPPTIALMLREVEKSPGCYRRVGLAFFKSDSEFENVEEEVVRIV